jgi:hypothetical protein
VLNRSGLMEEVRDLAGCPRAPVGWREVHAGFEPVSAETEVPEPLRRKLDELRAQSKKKADDRQ